MGWALFNFLVFQKGRLFEGGRLSTFWAFRVGAYSRWALIRKWAVYQINTILRFFFQLSIGERGEIPVQKLLIKDKYKIVLPQRVALH